MDFKNKFSNIFSYNENKKYSYQLSETQVSNNIVENSEDNSKNTLKLNIML